MVVSGMLTLGLISLWYFYWVPHLVGTYHYRLFYPKGLLEGFSEIIQYPFYTLDKFIFTSFYSFIAFAAFVSGLVLMIIKKDKLILMVFAVASAVFFVFVLKTGSVFSFHNYYIIPYVPIMALVAGYGISFFKIKMQYVLLFFISIESIANQSYDFLIKNEEKYKLSLENSIEGIIGKHDLIIVNGTHNPQTMYFLHRKGWTIENEMLNNAAWIQKKTKLGAKYLVIDKHHLNKVFDFPIVFEDENIKVYALKSD